VDESVVQFVALDQEHAHADLIGCLSLDLSDRVKVHLNALFVSLLLPVGLARELLNFLWLLKDEQVLVVNTNSLLGNLEVFDEDLRNLSFGVDHDLVVLLDIPEVSLV